eukprot:SM000067S20292  [mRNA]  locus=s67:73176:79809:- [translate_table: standard]
MATATLLGLESTGAAAMPLRLRPAIYGEPVKVLRGTRLAWRRPRAAANLAVPITSSCCRSHGCAAPLWHAAPSAACRRAAPAPAPSLWAAHRYRRQLSRGPPPPRAAAGELAASAQGGLDVIQGLGLDTLLFLVATVFVVPTFKAINLSPILGFLLSGIVLNQLKLIHNIADVKALSELGILFLLFEMGLELSLARLKALAKYAFGMGLAQVVLSTLAFTAFELPPEKAIGTRVLEFLFHARPDLVNIRSVDEALVIGAALAMSSSAFVLQLLAEKGELPTKFGSATLGILLLQDIAVVPLLVILPILELGDFTDESMMPVLVAASLKALLGLGLLLLAGRLLLRPAFEVVADSRSPEAFVAMCLLTVTGTSFLTQKLGFSDSLGAFLAGALLAETNYRTQVEADIRPFRGLLLGLFFVTTGTSIDLQLMVKEFPNIMALLGGLIAIKTTIITALGTRVGLTFPESVRTGLLLSQGGEFAFVVFSLANEYASHPLLSLSPALLALLPAHSMSALSFSDGRGELVPNGGIGRLGVLPLELNQLLIIVVVLSMALTPLLNDVGRRAAEALEKRGDDAEAKQQGGVQALVDSDGHTYDAADPVVIIGFGQMAQVLANFLATPLAAGGGVVGAGWPYVAFDLDPSRVKAARKLGFPVLYGDGSRPMVLQTAGITRPKAVMVMYTGKQKSVQSVERIRLAWPGVPIYARAQDLHHLLELQVAGATDAVLENTETSLRLGSILLKGLGVRSDDVTFVRRMMRQSMELRAREVLEKKDGANATWLAPFQAKRKQTFDANAGATVHAGECTDGEAMDLLPTPVPVPNASGRPPSRGMQRLDGRNAALRAVAEFASKPEAAAPVSQEITTRMVASLSQAIAGASGSDQNGSPVNASSPAGALAKAGSGDWATSPAEGADAAVLGATTAAEEDERGADRPAARQRGADGNDADTDPRGVMLCNIVDYDGHDDDDGDDDDEYYFGGAGKKGAGGRQGGREAVDESMQFVGRR